VNNLVRQTTQRSMPLSSWY